MKTPLISESHMNWDWKTLDGLECEIRRIAEEEFHLDTFPLHVRIVSQEQMLDAYASNGLPFGYAHWSSGKRFLANKAQHDAGFMGLAYEIVINSNPCVAYCMEDNTLTMQALVIAHAGFGHNAFFANNYLFKQWTNPKGILDYLRFAQEYVRECEEKHGIDEVEKVIDACHALASQGIDHYQRALDLNDEKREQRRLERLCFIEANLKKHWNDDLLKADDETGKCFPDMPEENILYFIEKNAPELPAWKREIIRIVRKIAQYFRPQAMSHMMNEGFACFWHYHIMERLYEKGVIGDGAWLEFLNYHTAVVRQRDFDEQGYAGINPYALGFQMFMDIKRICTNPTEEDRAWFKDRECALPGSDWGDVIRNAAYTYRDDNFIYQFLSPHLMRKFGFFVLLDDPNNKEHFVVTAIHDEEGYRDVRRALAERFNRLLHVPRVEVVNVDRRGDRTLTLLYHPVGDRILEHTSCLKTLQCVQSLWEFPVVLTVRSDKGVEPLGRIKQDGTYVFP